MTNTIQLYREMTPSLRAAWGQVVVSNTGWGTPANLKEMIDWCNANCTGRWTYGHGSGRTGTTFAFWFRAPIDRTGFALTWGLTNLM